MASQHAQIIARVWNPLHAATLCADSKDYLWLQRPKAGGDKVDYLVRSKATDPIQLHRYTTTFSSPCTLCLFFFMKSYSGTIQYVHFMIYAPIIFYFLQVELIFMNFPITQQLHYRRCLYPAWLKTKQNPTKPHPLHPTFSSKSCWHQIYSEVMGRCTPLLYDGLEKITYCWFLH